MSEGDDNKLQAKREASQLLRLHERILTRLQKVLEDVTSPSSKELVKEIKSRTGKAPGLGDITSAVEEAIRATKLAESQVRKAVMETPETMGVDGIPNLPAHLQRFLAERSAVPGFSFEVVQDEVRGWIICWKEYTHRGTVRGYGQISERPYAWLED